MRLPCGTEPLANNSEADLVPVTESVVNWSNGSGTLKKKQILIPASSVKGAISHRVAYHYNRLSGNFAGRKEGESEEGHAARIHDALYNNQAVQALFGYVLENKDDDSARIGCVIVDDVHLDSTACSAVQIPHNGIDRFTGGVRGGVLFFEEVVTHKSALPTLTLTLTSNSEPSDKRILQALECALDDLTQGRLALGAGSGRGGHGYFKGTWQWQNAAQPAGEQTHAA